MTKPLACLRIVAIALVALWTSPAFAADPPPLDAYGDLPGIEDMAMSTSGDKIAAISIVQGRRMLLILDSNLVLQSMLGVDDVKVRGISWVGDDEVLLMRSDTQDLGFGFTADQFEAYNAMLVPAAKDGKVKQVFADQKRVANAVFGNYGLRLVDGRWTGFYGGVELASSQRGFVFQNGRPSLFSVDMETGDLKQVARPAAEGHEREWLIDGRGKVAATLDIRDENGSWDILDSGNHPIASGKDPEGNVGLIAMGNAGDTIIYQVENHDTGYTDWYELPLDGSAEGKPILSDLDIQKIYLEKGTGRFIGYQEGGETSTPVFFDPKRQDAVRKTFAAFKGLDVNLVDWSTDFEHLLLRTSGNGDSGTWYLVDMTKGEAKAVGSERMKIRAESVGPISTVTYTAQDGLEMDGILTLPPGREAKNLPVILFPHGGPHGQDEPIFDWWAQAFASRGYAVFQPNFRGSTNMGEDFMNASRGEWGRKMQTDISDGLAELVRQGIADPKRACIMGGSYGGYAALAGVTLQQGLYRCAVAVAPVSDLEQMVHADLRESGGNNLLYRSLRQEMGGQSSLDDVSPRKHAAWADAPILLIHGRDDTVVPFAQSEKMADALKDAGKPYQFVELADEDHWLSRAATRQQMLEAAMAFVQKYDPAD